jgi:hypothetical protein
MDPETKRVRRRLHKEVREVTPILLRLPRPLYERAKFFVDRGSQDSVNDLVVNALSAYLRALERKAIDDAFRPMASDKRYQREALELAD